MPTSAYPAHVWQNCIGNQSAAPVLYFQPTTIEEVRAVVLAAEKNGFPVRALASGHSFSEVALTHGYMVDTHKLSGIISSDSSGKDRDLLKSGIDQTYLVHVAAGTILRDLNPDLWDLGMGLPNMGGYDAQTIAGVVSTATHGSGMKYGPISDLVQSLIMVSTGGIIYRIEPSNGITDPNKYRQRYPTPRNVLIQDDTTFNAVVVAMGCMGIAVSMILKLRKNFYLQEQRMTNLWSNVKEQELESGGFRNYDHFEIYVNPYKTQSNGKDNLCLLTLRQEIDPDKLRGFITPEMKHRSVFQTIASDFLGGALDSQSGLLRGIAKAVAAGDPPKTIDTSLNALVEKNYINRSYEVFNIGKANIVPAFSAEPAFPLANNTFIAATEYILRQAEAMKAQKIFHTSPISLRFIKQTSALLAMTSARDSCSIEMPMLWDEYARQDIQGGMQVLYNLEPMLMQQFQARPHWGQVNFFRGTPASLAQLYPRFDDWLRVYKQFNSKGLFSNPFTQRMGIDIPLAAPQTLPSVIAMAPLPPPPSSFEQQLASANQA
ncbi:MAG: FAD-binding protein [Candidatus Kapabacteria bacterium]|jgi:hypothetical protein|nr:FAD-binding protein [Candidatus Kapabacteria bacterium]